MIILQETEGERKLPICINLIKANTITTTKKKLLLPQPITHDLLNNIINKLNKILKSILIYNLKNKTFYTILNLHENNQNLEIDNHPNDTIALTLRTQTPI